jgi:aryl-alcohol dehydrogenase-like predicted oxidoreductase
MVLESIHCENIPLPVSRIGLGTWAIGGWMWGGTNDDDAVRTIQHALDQGINLIDTAPVYGFGHSEEIVGKALAEGGRRDRAVLATKVGIEWTKDGKVFRNSSPARIRKEIEDSLQRLQTDRIDIYQVHWPDPGVPIAETAETLSQLQREGKILEIGVSNHSPDQMAVWQKNAPLHSVQPPYNIFERQIENDVLPYAQSHGLMILAYGPLCRGLLSGKVTANRQFLGDDLRRIDPKFQEPRLSQYLNAVDRLTKLAKKRHGKRILAFAIRWVLDRGDRIAALWGARLPEQLDPCQEAFGWRLSDDDYAAVDQILAETIKDPVGPEFMAPPDA